jgi:putative ABC transport system permease protein
MLAKRPGFTAVIVLTLALGIGANTAIFSVVDAVVLRPLPFDDADQLVMVLATEEGVDFRSSATSYPDFADIREQTDTLEEVAIFHGTSSTLTGLDTPERLLGGRVSAGFFPLLRVQPALGRLFREEDDLPGGENVVVLSHGLWQRRFNGAPNTVGQTLTLDGTTHTVVGVLPAGFVFPVELADAAIWTPTAADADYFPNRGLKFVSMVGRRKPDVTLARAQAEMDTIALRLVQQYPETDTGRGLRLSPLHDYVVEDVRPAALVLLGAVGLVLLIACANVANLLLVRSAGREQELAIRAAVGAGRRRLVWQLLTESGLLAAIGGGLGLLFAIWGTGALVAMIPDNVPRTGQINVNERVLAFALLVSMATGLGFGLVPALSASRPHVYAALKDAARTTAGLTHHRLRNSLVVFEVALALVLLIGAGLMIRSFHRLTRVEYGFDPDKVLTFQMSVPISAYSDPAPRAALYGEVVKRLESVPGVKSAGAAASLPLRAIISLRLDIAGRPAPPPGEEPTARCNSVTADYFRTMGIALRKGRFFTEQDRRDVPGVAIINETMARKFWPNEDPIGQSIKPSAVLGDNDPERYEIVGVVADVRARGLDRAGAVCMYFPYEQQTWPFMSFAVRTTVDPLGLVAAVRREVAEVTEEEPAYGFKTMEQYAAASMGDRWFPMVLLGMFAALALILAGLGIYAVLSHSVAQRTHEIGVRMAMGAQKTDVAHLLLRRGLTLTTAGLGIGLLAAFALARVVASQLYEIGATDPLTFICVSLLLGTVALVASYIPARRATKVDPMVALRYE